MEQEVYTHDDDQELDNALECILFCAASPLSIKHLQEMVERDAEKVKEGLVRLTEKLEQPNTGLTLCKFQHGYQLRTKPKYAYFLKAFMKKRPWRISRQAMEVLSIIAYRQPIHRAAIDDIRGVDSSHLVHTLLDKELIRMSGRMEDLPGKPICYASTPKFLELFSLESLKQLPDLAEMKQELMNETETLS